MSMTFIYSSILDNVPGRKGFIIVSIIATGFAIADFLVLALHYVPPRQEPSYSGGVFIRPLKDLQFKKFISFLSYGTSPWPYPAPSFPITRS
jgi:hypothetical protein